MTDRKRLEALIERWNERIKESEREVATGEYSNAGCDRERGRRLALRECVSELQDELAAVVGASPPQPELQLRGLLQDFTARQRALIEARGKGGQHTGQSPSITPSVLRELEWMLRNSAGSREGD